MRRHGITVTMLLAAASTSALRAAAPARVQMETRAASPAMSAGWQTVVKNAQGRAASLKEDQDAVAAVMSTGTLACFSLPGVLLLPFDNFIADLILSSIVGCGLLGGFAGFSEGAAGDAVRGAGRTISSGTGWVVAKLPLDKLPGGDGEGLSMTDIKKYGVAGTIAYILTELAFWAVAFPVASTSFYNLNGHWPDFGDGSDRTAVLAFIFAGANVARLV
eukprot:5168812-Prymnesium_polylepis.1